MQRFMAESCDEVIHQLLRIPSHGNLKGYVREMCPQQPLFQRHVAVHLQTAGKLCHLRACFAMQLYHLEPAVSCRSHPAHHRHTDPFIHASSRFLWATLKCMQSTPPFTDSGEDEVSECLHIFGYWRVGLVVVLLFRCRWDRTCVDVSVSTR